MKREQETKLVEGWETITTECRILWHALRVYGFIQFIGNLMQWKEIVLNEFNGKEKFNKKRTLPENVALLNVGN